MFKRKFGIIALILCVVLTVGYFSVNTGAISTVLLAIQGTINDGNLVKFSGTNGIGVDTGLSATNVVKCKFDATSAPTVNNDVDEGYTIGSQWCDITNDKEYACLDNTDGAAVWTETTQSGGSETFTGLSDTPANYTGQASKYTKVNVGETALEFGTIDLSLYYLKTEIDTQGKVEAIWEVTLATDSELAAYTPKSLFDAYTILYADTDNTPAALSIVASRIVGRAATGGIAALDKAAVLGIINVEDGADVTDVSNVITALGSINANALADITSPGANIEDAVTKKHTSGSETQGGDISGTVGNASVDKIKRGLDASKSATPAVGDIYLATDTDKLYKCITAEAWTLLKNLDLSGNNVADLADVASAGVDIEDAVDKKHSQNTDTDLDATFEATFVKKADTVNVLSDITSAGADIEDAVTKKHTAGTDTTLGIMTDDINMGTHKLTGLSVPSASGQSVRTTATITEANLEDAISKKHTQNNDTQFDFYNALSSDHTWSGDKDTQPVGESVVFGDLLYFDWTDKEWKKTDADAAATMPGLRIALETKTDGQTCLMLVKGYIRDDSAFEFVGSMVYSSVTLGAMSSTAPTETGDQVQRVGVAKSADILFFDPSIDVGEI